MEGHCSPSGRCKIYNASLLACLQVLSGKVKPGQSSDPASGYATVEKGALSMAPSLGGGETPLTGARKVEAMLGIKRGALNGNASMAPPPARKPRTG